MSKTLSNKEIRIQIAQMVKSRFIVPTIPYSSIFELEVDDDFEKVPPPTKSELKELLSFINNNDPNHTLKHWKGLLSFRANGL